MNVAERVGDTSDGGSRRKKTAREAHCESLDSGLIPYALEFADRASAAFGVEARYPFFDRRLMEFCVALPADQKLKQGWTRSVMRRAMTGILPAEVQWRIGKANLSPNFNRRLLDFGRPAIEKIIENGLELFESYVNMLALRDAYHRYSSQPTRSNQDALTVYGAVMLGCWLRKSGFASTAAQSQEPLAGRLPSASQVSDGGLCQTSRLLRARGTV